MSDHRLTETERTRLFADRVRELYTDLFSDDWPDDNPLTLGALIVGISVEYLDGDFDYIAVRSAPKTHALGLARQLEADFIQLNDE